MNTQTLEKLGLTVTQAAYWLDVEAKFLADALAEEEMPQWAIYSLEAMEEEYKEDPEYFEDFHLGAQLKERSWASATARAAIPVLIEQARKKELITYRDLDSELRRRDSTRGNAGTLQKYGRPLGTIGDVIDEIRQEAEDDSSKVAQENAGMPPLEALVVRGREQLPGKGIDYFLISYLRSRGEAAPEDLMLRDRDRRTAIEGIHADIFAWNDWSLLEKLAKR